MGSLASRIAAKRSSVDRKSVEVEEWGDDGDPVVLYFSDVTALDIQKIERKHPGFMAKTTMPAMVETIILKCEDEHGEPVFSVEDKPTLMREPIGVIAKLFGAIFNATPVEDHEKN